MTDCHGIGRGKIIRRHELESLSINLSDKFSGINKSVGQVCGTSDASKTRSGLIRWDEKAGLQRDAIRSQ
jgi:hypothetical protein